MSAESDIRALFSSYGAGFDDADPDEVTSLFAWPVTIWQFGKGHVFEGEDELSENVDALMDVFDEAGIVSTIPEVKDVRIASSTAFADVVWRQEDDQGELLHQFSCQYLLLEQEGSWRIATIVNEDARGDE